MQVQRNLKAMSADEIIRLFDWLDFKDEIGHKLVNCVDFLALVDLAVTKVSNAPVQRRGGEDTSHEKENE